MWSMLEDLALCAYALCEDDFSTAKEHIDCVPESLHVLYNIANMLGIKIRFSTISILADHVIEVSRFREKTIEQIISLLKKIAQGEKILESAKTLLNIMLGREIKLNLNEQEAAELAIATVYASITKILNKAQDLEQPLETTILTPIATTITT